MATITDLTTLAVNDVATDDYVPIYDASTTTDKKVALYASGSWTPALNFGGATTGITYSGASGFYMQTGKLVFIQGVILLTSKGSAGSGNANIAGFPVTSSAYTYAILSLSWQNMTSSYVNMHGFVSTSTAYASIRGITAAATTNLTNVAFGDFANNTILYIHGVYRAA